MTDNTIHSKALLVGLSISSWSARKFDRVVSEQVNRDHGASSNAGRFNKRLMPEGADAYENLVKLVQEIRAWHYAHTLPWSDGASGWRLLSSAGFMKYTDETRRMAIEFDRLADIFEESYPALREEARATLGDLYRDKDYPSAEEIRGKFAFRLEFAPLPMHGDFRLDLPSAERENLEEQVQARIRAATEKAMEECWARLHEVVAKTHERLTDEKTGIFRDTLVSNIRDVVDVIAEAHLNITDDPRLDELRQRVLDELTVHEPQTLRDDPEVRQATADKAEEILAAMSEVYGGAR